MKTTEWHRHERMFEGRYFTLSVGWSENEEHGIYAIGTVFKGPKEIDTAEKCREAAALYTEARECITSLEAPADER